MDISDIGSDLSRLDTGLDQLEQQLKPLLALAETASQLPLLERAKLYTLAAYSIESLLFSALRLSGANAKDHAVFAELTRVRQYFEKIKKIETPPEPREKSLNTTAAIRFLKADLSDNQKIKNKLNEQLAKEKAKAEAQLAQRGKKRRAEESPKRERSGLDSGNSGQPGQGARLSKHNRRQEEQ